MNCSSWRTEASKAAREALTVPKRTWFLSTMSRMMPSSAISMGLVPAGTPLRMQDAVGGQRVERSERHLRRADGFEHDVEVAGVRREIERATSRAPHVVGANERTHPRAVVSRLKRIDEGLDVTRHQHHGAQKADRPRPEHERAHAGGLPGISSEDRIQLDRGLGGDGERLDQDSHSASECGTRTR